MNELNSDLNQNDLQLQNADQTDNPVSGQGQKLIPKQPKNDAEWNMSPAELYGCLCHKVER
jgi:hypothetical protein